MVRAVLIFVITFSTLCVRGQNALSAFTNCADYLLRRSWGFGVNEIPIYCSTNALIRYNGGIHSLLQQAVDSYDQTNHGASDFDFPSVFRPQFAVVTNDGCVSAMITNWVEVTIDYADIMSRPFKVANDPTLSADDNVRGIGLIVGSKPAVPIFNYFNYANTFSVNRKLLFRRSQPATPPFATNQMYILSLSNAFGCSAINTWTQALALDVTIYLTNSATVSLTNELGAGVTNSFANGLSQVILSNQWSRYSYGHTNMFEFFTNSGLTLPLSSYVEQTRQFGGIFSSDFETNAGLPVHSWFVQVTNQVVYALVDNASGRILDFVNYDNFGTTLELMHLLQSNASPAFSPSPWDPSGADSSLWSPPSAGVLYQIAVVTNNITRADYNPQYGAAQALIEFLNGTDPTSNLFMQCAYVPSASVRQIASWWVATDQVGRYMLSPGNHFTTDEMASTTSTSVYTIAVPPFTLNVLLSQRSWPSMQMTQLIVNSNNIAVQFNAYTDGQYGLWSSSDLANWAFAGVAAKVTNNSYQCILPATSDSANVYFQARKF